MLFLSEIWLKIFVSLNVILKVTLIYQYKLLPFRFIVHSFSTNTQSICLAYVTTFIYLIFLFYATVSLVERSLWYRRLQIESGRHLGGHNITRIAEIETTLEWSHLLIRLFKIILVLFIDGAKRNLIFMGHGGYSHSRRLEGAQFRSSVQISFKLLLISRLLIEVQDHILELTKFSFISLLKVGKEDDLESSFQLMYSV